MEDGSQPLGDILLQWVRTFRDDGEEVTWSELSDGQALWTILQDIDKDYFAQDLPEPAVSPSSDWTRKWQNLKFVDRQVSTYYRDVCNSPDELGRALVPDLQAIASQAAEEDLEKFIMIVLRVSMASPASNQRMAQRLMGLGMDNARIIAGHLKQMDDGEESGDEVDDADDDEHLPAPVHDHTPGPKLEVPYKINGASMYRDPRLEHEEDLLQAHATIDRLQALNAKVERQLEDLRQDKDRLQEALDVFRSEVDTRGGKVAGDEALKKLQRQAENDRDYIAELETQLEESKDAVERHEKQIERFKVDTDSNHKLQDDLQVLKAENEDLVQKIKGSENLKKKIQTLQEHDRANAALRDDLKEAHERLDDLDKLKQAHALLEKEVIEKKGLIRNQEYQITELTTTRKQVEYDGRVLAQKLQTARERHDRDHEAIIELQERVQAFETGEGDEAKPHKLDNELAAQEREPRKQLKSDETRHLTEKLALLEQQLSHADVRYRELSNRNAELENRRESTDTEAHKHRHRIEEQDVLIGDLKHQLESAAKQPQAAPERDMAALERENQLVAAAWYDLSSRLQSNNFSLARRREGPKSWLGKQRALVGSTSEAYR